MEFSEKLNRANGRLKASKLRVRLVQRGDRLYCRGTFPPPPDSTKDRPYQQRIALGLPANLRGLELAEKQARDIGTDLDAGRFDWALWRGQQGDTVGEWVEQFKGQWSGADITWKTNYQQPFNKLPTGATLTIALLKQTLENATEANSRTRLKAYDAFRQLATLAGMDPAPLKPLKGKYSATEVDPRDLPTDSQIAEWRETISDRGWQWVYGMIAAYGLRGHEVYRADLVDFPTVRIPEDTKTGARFVWPLYPEWAERWNLSDRHWPPLQDIPHYSNAQLGTKTAKFFERMLCNAYDIRHCYARRCLEFGYAPEFGAKMMGHSPEVHNRTYRRWIDEGVYWAIYQKGIKGERPKAP